MIGAFAWAALLVGQSGGALDSEVIVSQADGMMDRMRICGPDSAYFSLRILGRTVDYQELRSRVHVNAEGVNLEQLRELFASYGVAAYVIQCEQDSLESLPLPAMLVLGGKHCVVVHAIDVPSGKAQIFEPARRKIVEFPLEAVRRQWDGRAIVFAEPPPSRRVYWIMFAASVTAAFFVMATGATLRTLRRRSPAARGGFTLLELLVAVAIIAVLVALSIPAVQKVRAASARLRCQNNLRQLGLASHLYHDSRQAFPAGCSYQPPIEPYPHMTWMTRLLPFLEQESVWQEAVVAFSRDSFFESAPHLPILGRVMPMFLCPLDAAAHTPRDFGSFVAAFTSYMGINGTSFSRTDGILFLNSQVRIAEILDGTSNTLMIGERPPSQRGNFGWWYAGWGQRQSGSLDSHLGVRELNMSPADQTCYRGPYSFRPGDPNSQCSAFHFWSWHPGGANFLFADGSVHFLRYSADPVMPALATRAGGESFDWPP